MKKTIVASALALSLALTPAFAMCGDVDADGVSGVLDAFKVAQHAAGVSLIDTDMLIYSDVDQNGAADIIDALRIARTSAGLPETLSCATLPGPPAPPPITASKIYIASSARQLVVVDIDTLSILSTTLLPCCTPIRRSTG